MRRFLRNFLVALLALGGLGFGFLWATNVTAEDLRDLKRGDVIFQISGSGQSLAIMLASASLYSHVGIVDLNDAGQPVVLEAVGPVRETPLEDWISKGKARRVAVYRMEKMTEVQAQSVVTAARAHFGKGYDPYFYSSEDTLYCSELVQIAFRDGIGLTLGQSQRLGDLNLDNFAARAVIERRWKGHPLCADGRAGNAAECLALIRDEKLITPQAIADDPRMVPVFSNFAP
ncbi:YiiX/YebB-like N1pC/P60 family cysteine hydrolase [Neogemmobacter tilapiae]|uniref:YiiX family permuted papain-like enzyme n=1 Tax=Neogemmobacter tilapiae TaxID=875041 RepID=A0A918WGH8_9RHOB|nr:YiiX/YebB-like N1pC/P60 family cysteine hydrolase [Gemmobacter tilapiae]GHC44334.1 hypothetical protein GCM10007315_01880 [Gemmobacter tilapiae]